MTLHEDDVFGVTVRAAVVTKPIVSTAQPAALRTVDGPSSETRMLYNFKAFEQQHQDATDPQKQIAIEDQMRHV